MDFKKVSAQQDRENYFRNIALKASQICLKSFEGEDLEEEDQACLKKAAINLHSILDKGEMESYSIFGEPWKSY